MRSDMAQVLVERPRKGSRLSAIDRRKNRRVNKYNMRLDENGDFAINKEGMLRPYDSRDERKQLNENLKPLKRFLASRVGQSWDKVYSEIMEHLNLNNATQYHVWQHLIDFEMVITKTFMLNNMVMTYDMGGAPTELGSYCDEFYVDPRDNTLRLARGQKSRYRRTPVLFDNRRLHPKNELKQFWQLNDGVWYEFTFRHPTKEERQAQRFGTKFLLHSVNPAAWYINPASMRYCRQIMDSINYYWSSLDAWSFCKETFGSHILPVAKRQLSSKDLTILKLR